MADDAPFRSLARNNAFSNARLLQVVRRLSSAEFAATRTGFFPSIRETTNHILSVDLFYLDALEEGGRGLAAYGGYEPFDEAGLLAEAQAEADARLIAFCDKLDRADHARRVPTDRGVDGIVEERVDRLLLHLFQHQIHHRGQVHAMLSGTGEAPPQLDEFFLDYDRERRAGELDPDVP